MIELTYNQVISINEQIVNHTGEPFSIVNESAIKSAIGNQFQPYDSLEQAIASVFKSLILNHGFQNGNKRTAVACLKVFNVDLKCTDEQLVDLVYKIASENGGQISVNHIANILFDLKLDEDLTESIHLIDKENKNCYYTRSAYDVRNFIDDRLVHGAMSVIKICYYFESGIYLFADGYDCIHEMLEEMAVEQGLVYEDELSERYLVYSKDNDDIEVIDYSEGKVFAYKNFKVFDASHNQTFKETELYNILSWPVKEFKMMNGMFIKDGKAVTSLKNESLNESDDTLYYHGSSQKGLNKLTSPINWITDDKEYAKYYALALSDTAYVYICEADLDNIFDAGRTGDNVFALMPITKPYKLSIEMKRLADRLNLSEEDAYKLVQDAISEYPQNNEYRTKISTVVRSNAFKKILQEKGYTSIHTIEYNVPESRYCDCYGILDSNDIKILSCEEVTRDAKLNDK